MNLNDNPSLDDLKQLFARLKDKNHNHILWVCESGAVHIDRLPGGETPEQFEQRHPSLRIRFKTYNKGGGYVGKSAAADDNFIRSVHAALQEHWRLAGRQQQPAYVDRYY